MSLYFDEQQESYRISINRMIAAGGEKRRVRATKKLPRGTSREQAEAIHSTMEAQLFVRQTLTVATREWPDYVAAQLDEKKSWLYKTLRHAKARAQLKGMTCSLTVDDIEFLLLRSKGRCEVTGIAFHVNGQTGNKIKPYFHSLDRIESSRGYFRSNCRIVCYAVNVAMLHWGEDVFSNLATGFVINKFCSLGLVQHLKA